MILKFSALKDILRKKRLKKVIRSNFEKQIDSFSFEFLTEFH